MIKALHSKGGAAGLSVGSNATLILLKLTVGIMTGSVSVISEAIHSSIDLLAALIALFSVQVSDLPPDDDHPYGHGKIENISGTVEAFLIFAAALYIVYEAVEKILNGVTLEHLGLGAGIMAFSAVANTFVSRHLSHVACEKDSIALEADAWHLYTDVFTSVGVFAGLAVVWLTGWTILDPIIAIGVALFICKAAWDLTRRSSAGLLDTKLPQEEEGKVREVLKGHYGLFVDFHGLRSRKAGSRRHVDLHLVMDGNKNVAEAHQICDHLEEEIESELPNTDVTIHVEPLSANGADGGQDTTQLLD
ncbi:MAG: cation diffusion facilitator family transporter [Chloroflexi bacterium]|nr:cation diffusion facilitator family transporter [Chloroflexota bacterium]